MKTYKLEANNIDGVYEVKRFDPAATIYMATSFEHALASLKDGETIHAIYSQNEIDALQQSYTVDFL
jgi:hypothetical protein